MKVYLLQHAKDDAGLGEGLLGIFSTKAKAARAAAAHAVPKYLCDDPAHQCQRRPRLEWNLEHHLPSTWHCYRDDDVDYWISRVDVDSLFDE